jgi:hypothetical protein
MDYDLAIPPEGLYLSGQTTVIREIERRGGTAYWDNPEEPAERQDRTDAAQADRKAGPGRAPDNGAPATRDRRPGKRPPPAQPAWQHQHKSPWAPPTSVMDFEMDYDSFWQDDPAKRERREQDSREIWY